MAGATNQKILAFSIDVRGATTQAKEISQIDIALGKLNKTRTALLKKTKDGNELTKKENTQLARLTTQIKDHTTQKARLTKVENTSAKAFRASRGSMEALRAETSRLIQKSNQLNLSTEQGRKAFEKNRKTIQANKKEIRNFDRQLSGSSTLVGEYEKGFSQAFVKIGAGITAVVAAWRTLNRVIGDSIQAFSDWERGQTNVQTLLEEFDNELEGKSIKLMTQYGLTIQDYNKALFDAVSAGVDAGKSQEFMATAAQLAIGGVTDLTTSVDGITSVINAYGLSLEEADQVAAAFFTAQKFGKTTVAELASSIGQVAPIANQLDISYQELLTTFAELTKQGIRTDLAVTAIKSTMTALQKPSEQARKKFKELGIATGATAIKANGLFNTLVQVSQATEKDADALAEMIPNVRALTGVGALGTRQLEEYAEILEVVNTDYGKGSSLARAFAMQQETLAQAQARVKAGFTAAKIAVGEFFSPMIKGFADLVNPIEKTSEGLIKQKVELNLLVGAATAANNTQESRLRILKEIQGKYPDFLKNLDIEKVSNEDLSKALVDVNAQFEKKIKLAIAEEIYTKNASKLADQYIKEVNTLKEIQVIEARIANLRGVNTPEAISAAAGYRAEVNKLERSLERQRERQHEVNATAQAAINLIKVLDQTIEGSGGAGGGGNVPDPKDPNAVTVDRSLPVFDLERMKDTSITVKEFTEQTQNELLALFGEGQSIEDQLWEIAATQRLNKERRMTEQLKLEAQKRQLIQESVFNAVMGTSNFFYERNQKLMDQELAAAGDNAAAREAIEKKYAKKKQRIAYIEAIIGTANAVINALQTKPYLPLGPIMAAAAGVQGAIQVATIAQQKFATGGKVKSGYELPGSTPGTDNTLALVKPGEVVLNKRQQSFLGGPDTFRKAGVPGFASGGVIPGAAPTQSAGFNLDLESFAERIITGINDKGVNLNLHELRDKEKELALTTTPDAL